MRNWLVQVIKRMSGYRLDHIERRLAHGSLRQAHKLLTLSQTESGRFNTAYVERLNATLWARIPSLVRRTRNLAHTQNRLDAELFWATAIYNFCTAQTTLGGTPAMAANITKVSVRRLLFMRTPYILQAELDHVIL